ncbi:MAG: hypothetical protein KAH12_12185 [Anaerolineales bacterium]|nr:hypothetical protein [Anaerolineales bacterium]
MALEPSSVQRDKMLAHGKTKLILVQFLVMKDMGFVQDYLNVTNQAVQKESGTREHQLKIDQVFTNGELPYHYLTADNFPSSQALLLAHENSREIRQSSLNEIYGLIVRPNPTIKKVAGGFGFLSSFLTRLLGTSEVKGLELLKDHDDKLDPETEPNGGKVLEFSSEKIDEAFYMMNLNQFSPSPRRGEGGRSAYNQYSARIMPRLVSVGGYPDIYGKILSTYIGDQKSSLYNSWHDFALVYYPSRTSFLRLMTNTPRGTAEIRRSALKKVVLLASSNL